MDGVITPTLRYFADPRRYNALIALLRPQIALLRPQIALLRPLIALLRPQRALFRPHCVITP